MLQAAYILAGTPALPLSSEVVAHLVVRYGVPAPELRPGFVDIGVDRLGIPLQEPIDHRLRDRGIRLLRIARPGSSALRG